jgi:hypothetical protein
MGTAPSLPRPQAAKDGSRTVTNGGAIGCAVLAGCDHLKPSSVGRPEVRRSLAGLRGGTPHGWLA